MSVLEAKGYHLDDIPRGKLGESSKVYEECLEFIDAEKQGVKLMVLQELSDLILVIRQYLEKHYPGITLEDLVKMGNVTERAFKSGLRKSKE